MMVGRDVTTDVAQAGYRAYAWSVVASRPTRRRWASVDVVVGRDVTTDGQRLGIAA